MLEKLQMYINGEWVDSHSTETIEVMNPSDDSVLGMIAAGNSDDVDKAVAAAKEAFDDLVISLKSKEKSLTTLLKDEEENVELEFKSNGVFDVQLKFAGDTLLFHMHSNIFDFPPSHEIFKSKS